MLRDNGITAEARGFDYRASQLARRVPTQPPSWFPTWLYSPWNWTGRGASKLMDITSRYGFSPGRVLFIYGLAILIFAIVYGITGSTSWPETLPYSLIAFHGRGVVNGTIGSNNPLVWIPALEAVVGLLVEVLLVATLIRRLFRE